jgi:hypothetical protein
MAVLTARPGSISPTSGRRSVLAHAAPGLHPAGSEACGELRRDHGEQGADALEVGRVILGARGGVGLAAAVAGSAHPRGAAVDGHRRQEVPVAVDREGRQCESGFMRCPAHLAAHGLQQQSMPGQRGRAECRGEDDLWRVCKHLALFTPNAPLARATFHAGHGRAAAPADARVIEPGTHQRCWAHPRRRRMPGCLRRLG